VTDDVLVGSGMMKVDYDAADRKGVRRFFVAISLSGFADRIRECVHWRPNHRLCSEDGTHLATLTDEQADPGSRQNAALVAGFP